MGRLQVGATRVRSSSVMPMRGATRGMQLIRGKQYSDAKPRGVPLKA